MSFSYFLQECEYKTMLSSMCKEVDRRDSELSKLRDRVNTLIVALSDLKKELEVRCQEVVMVKREANSQIR